MAKRWYFSKVCAGRILMSWIIGLLSPICILEKNRIPLAKERRDTGIQNQEVPHKTLIANRCGRFTGILVQCLYLSIICHRAVLFLDKLPCMAPVTLVTGLPPASQIPSPFFVDFSVSIWSVFCLELLSFSYEPSEMSDPGSLHPQLTK